MEASIFYYTGTGNSLWVARLLAGQLGEARLASMSDLDRRNDAPDSKVLGLVFPVHAWGLPTPVIKFAGELKVVGPEYVFAVAVNAGQVSNTLVQLRRILSRRGIHLASGFDIPMPSNYIPWGGPGPREEQQRRFDAAKARISEIGARIKHREESPVEKGPLWQRIVYTGLYRMSLPQFPKLDQDFRADAKCNACGMCSRVCPSHNIYVQEGKPV